MTGLVRAAVAVLLISLAAALIQQPHAQRARFQTRALIASPGTVGGVSLARMVGQMVMAGMDGTSPSPQLLGEVRRGEIGGIILYSGNVSPRLPAALRLLQHTAALGHNPPLLISVDQEGGPIRRFPVAPPTVGPREMVSAGQAFQQGLATGRFLSARGVNVDLAPVSDVTTSSASFEVRQDRGFSGDPGRVASLAGAFTRGLQSAGPAATAKHFPGVGPLRRDTDVALQTISSAAADIRRNALRPFRVAMRDGVKLVMVASAIYPALDPTRTPAGFSQRIIEGLLRGELGFRGVVITDALDTPPGLGDLGNDAVRAARAGADIVLYAPASDGPLAYRHLLAAARAGTLARARVLDAYQRVLALKRWLTRRRA
jgi:beta-N-acetylhexosaminidase